MKKLKKFGLYAMAAGTWLLSQIGIGTNPNLVQANVQGDNENEEIELNYNHIGNVSPKLSDQVNSLLANDVKNIQYYGHRSHRSHRSHYSGSGRRHGGSYSGGSYSGGGYSSGGSSGGSSSSNEKKDIISISAIQQQLNLLGYDCGAVDGKKGASTITAIKNFQIEYGLEADGYVDWQTEAWLNATKIDYVRDALINKGYKLDAGGGRTQSVIDAIKDFQGKNGLDVNGRIDLKTKQALGC